MHKLYLSRKGVNRYADVEVDIPAFLSAIGEAERLVSEDRPQPIFRPT